MPVGAVLLAFGARLLPADAGGRRARLDLAGALLLAAATLLAVVPLLFGREAGWPPWTWASLAACAPVAALFARRQRRAASPLLALGVLGLGLGFAPQLGRLTANVPDRHAADLSGLVNMNFQLAGVAGVAVFGALYLGFPGGPGPAFTAVALGFGATALAAAAASFAGHRAARREGQGSRPARRAEVTASSRV
ncbi:hypothetical protein [Actinomadura coerulea]|uniref:hypothetical protein n=1 Tax=Actinomadura coerulea TaxID=46159 RepID=UPI00341ED778